MAIYNHELLIGAGYLTVYWTDDSEYVAHQRPDGSYIITQDLVSTGVHTVKYFKGSTTLLADLQTDFTARESLTYKFPNEIEIF